MLKRSATIVRTLRTSSRLYAPVAPRNDVVLAAPCLSPHKLITCNRAFSHTSPRDIFKKYLGTGIDRWVTSKENSIASCLPHLSGVMPSFSKRSITTMGNPVESVSQDSSTLASVPPPRIKFKRLDKTARHIMQILDKEAVEQVNAEREIPDIRPGYIIQLKLEVPENKRRVSIIKGIVIARRNAGLNSTIRLRRLVAGVGVESLLPLYSPNIKEIKVLDKKKVRRAKLYYLRDKMNALKKH